MSSKFGLGKTSLACVLVAGAVQLSGCATESHRTLEVPKVASASTSYVGVRSLIAVGKFDNRSNFMRGIFSDGVDRLGSQAKTILMTHLHQTGRFNVLDRDNMAEIKQEAALSGATQKLKGATYVITGDVTEFGRGRVKTRRCAENQTPPDTAAARQ